MVYYPHILHGGGFSKQMGCLTKLVISYLFMRRIRMYSITLVVWHLIVAFAGIWYGLRG